MKKILIIDDDQDFVAVTTKVLSHIGKFEVQSFTDSATAIEGIRRIKPDLVMLDIMMPKVDGLTILKNIKSSDDLKHIKVVVCSAKIFDVDRKNALKLGADEYVSKVAASNQIIDTLNKILGNG